MKFNYSKIKVSDLDFVHKLFKVDEYKDIFFEHNTSIVRWKERFNDIKMFEIIVDKGKPIGVINLERKDDAVSILLLAIDVNLLYKGFGKRILLDVLEMHQFKTFVLTVMKSNDRAVKFYQKMGFTILEEILEDYGKNGKHESYNMIRKGWLYLIISTLISM